MQKSYYLSAIILLLLLSGFNTLKAQYCIPTTTYAPSAYNMYIDSVSLGDINNQDSYSPTDTCYNDYTQFHQTTLTRGQNYSMTIKAGPTTYFNYMHYAAWIDYNNDEVFTADEKLGQYKTVALNEVFTISFTVPADAPILTTRLRVRCTYNSGTSFIMDPCITYYYGETEDYTVSISDFLKVGTGIPGTYGDISFFNYNTDADYDLMLVDEITFGEDPITFYFNTAGSFTLFDYVNGDLPELDIVNISSSFCDLNNDNQLDVLFTYRYDDDYPATRHFEKQGSLLTLMSSGFPDLMRGSIKAADLNNDGRQDVILCGQDIDDVKHTYIYENTPGGFVLVNNKLKGIRGDIQTVDYDGDMDIDIFISGDDTYGNSNAIIYRNDNNWKFTNIMADLKKISWTDRAEFGDFNNDGLPDIVVGDQIYRNNGDDTFSEIYLELEDFLYSPCHWGDMDGDGYPEMISMDSYGPLIFKYNGVDSFLLDERLYADGSFMSIGDYNADKRQDIAINHYVEISFFKNQSSFTNLVPEAPTNLYSSIGDSGYYSVNLYWNDGQDDYTPAEGLTYNLRVGTTSGGNDIVSSMTSPSDYSLLKPGPGNVYSNNSWFLKNLSPGTYYWSIQSVDNSGLTSPFSDEQQFEILAPLTVSVFDIEGKISAAGSGVDFDADNDIDLIVYDSLLSIHEQVSPYVYNYHKVDTRAYLIDIKDLNNDNLPDLIARHNKIPVQEQYDSLVLYINKGDFTFDLINLDTLTFTSAAAADFDNDGDIDIIIHEEGYFLFENVDSLQYNRIQLPLSEILTSNSTLSAIDIDRDNDMDFIISGDETGHTGICHTYVYKNLGDMDFTLSQELFPGLGPTRFMPTAEIMVTIAPVVTWNDFNFDGYPDLIITGNDAYQNTNNLIYLNDGTGILVLTDISPRPANKFSTSWIDFNTDGYLDIIMPKMGWTVENMIYLNDNNNGYNGFPNLADSLTTAMYIDAIDVDNDYDKDIICTYKIPTGAFTYKPGTKIYTNNYNFTNYPPSPPASISHEIDSFTVILSWDKGLDDLTAYEGNTYNIWVGATEIIPDIISPLSDLNTGYRYIEDIGNAGTNLSRVIENLPLGKYYWSVQTIDNSLQGSEWAPVSSFEISALTVDFENDTVCLGFYTHFTDRSVSTDAIDSWHWDFGNGNYSSLQNPSHIFSQSGDNSVKLVVVSGTSVDSVIKNVYVKPLPDTDFNADDVCDGATTTFTNTSVLNGTTISSWYWDFGDGQTSIMSQPPPHGYLNPGDYSTQLKAWASNGCTDSVTKVVSVGAYPVAEITANSPMTFCSGDSVTLSVSYNNNFVYQWKSEGTGITGADSNKYVSKLSGSYSVEATNTLGNCKTMSSPVDVTVKPMPYEPVITSDNYKAGECMGETPIMLYMEQEVPGYSYQWYRNGIPVAGETLSYIEDFLTEGDYSLEVDLDGCTAVSDVVSVYFEDAPDKPFIYAQGPIVWYLACSNDSAATYRWYCNDKLIESADDYYYIAGRKMGDYQLSIGNELGCLTRSDIVTIPTGNVGIYDVDPFEGLKIYPNPSNGHFIAEIENEIFGDLLIKIISQDGKELYNFMFEKTSVHFIAELNISEQPEGYYLIIFDLNKHFTVRRIIID